MHEVIGQYRVHEVVGKGGMGVVYRGQHAATGVEVAIKVVSHAASQVVAGIRRELHALERVHHPSVVRILDQGTLDGLPWYAMELLHGHTLRALHSQHWGRSSSALPTVCDELAKTIVGGGGDAPPRLPPPPLVPPPQV